MKKGTKICIGVNVVCCLCAFIIIGAITAVFISIEQKAKGDPGFCTRAHAAEAMSCAQKDRELGAAAATINSTDVILLPPGNYSELMTICKATLECARNIKCKAIRKILNEMSICGFVYFYTNEFSACAEKLIEKKDEVACLGDIFNRNDEMETNKICRRWKDSTPCFKNAIKQNCDDKLGILQYKFEKKARKADNLFCEDDENIQQITSEEEKE